MSQKYKILKTQTLFPVAVQIFDEETQTTDIFVCNVNFIDQDVYFFDNNIKYNCDEVKWSILRNLMPSLIETPKIPLNVKEKMKQLKEKAYEATEDKK
jgi:hypothetical protein